MKYIRNYKVFENNTDLTEDQHNFLDNCTYGKWKVNPDTGLIDVWGDFYCSNRNLDDLKGLRFGNVSGDFFCGNNHLKTLDGSPRKIGESFLFQQNPLISLEGAPLEVERHFIFYNYYIKYNLNAFLEEIKEGRTGYPELLLTHHFLTPKVIKEEITKNPYFCYYVSKAWNTLYFEKKQDELTSALPFEILQKINDRWINEIKQDDDFCKSFCKYWNTPEFKTKQDELTRTLPPETLQKIKDFLAIIGYL